jgi:glycosyltransferase involved in cell wall biosynthesis
MLARTIRKLQILVVSDASDDGTDDIVRAFADRGVELLKTSTGGEGVALNPPCQGPW